MQERHFKAEMQRKNAELMEQIGTESEVLKIACFTINSDDIIQGSSDEIRGTPSPEVEDSRPTVATPERIRAKEEEEEVKELIVQRGQFLGM